MNYNSDGCKQLILFIHKTLANLSTLNNTESSLGLLYCRNFNNICLRQVFLYPPMSKKSLLFLYSRSISSFRANTKPSYGLFEKAMQDQNEKNRAGHFVDSNKEKKVSEC